MKVQVEKKKLYHKRYENNIVTNYKAVQASKSFAELCFKILKEQKIKAD